MSVRLVLMLLSEFICRCLYFVDDYLVYVPHEVALELVDLCPYSFGVFDGLPAVGVVVDKVGDVGDGPEGAAVGQLLAGKELVTDLSPEVADVPAALPVL